MNGHFNIFKLVPAVKDHCCIESLKFAIRECSRINGVVVSYLTVRHIVHG